MHRPQKNTALAAIYSLHTLNHHKFLTDNEMRFKRTSRLACCVLSAICNGRLYFDVATERIAFGMAGLFKRRHVNDLHDDRHVPRQ